MSWTSICESRGMMQIKNNLHQHLSGLYFVGDPKKYNDFSTKFVEDIHITLTPNLESRIRDTSQNIINPNRTQINSSSLKLELNSFAHTRVEDKHYTACLGEMRIEEVRKARDLGAKITLVFTRNTSNMGVDTCGRDEKQFCLSRVEYSLPTSRALVATIMAIVGILGVITLWSLKVYNEVNKPLKD